MSASRMESSPGTAAETADAPSPAASLADLKPGERARILSLDANDPALFRLAELGLIPGEELLVIKEAPLGDPIEIRIMEYMLCLRRREAQFIRVEPLPANESSADA